jgi:ADP-ribosylglycohydrolase
MQDRNDLLNRICGCLYGQAIGDALGAGYEFQIKTDIANQYRNKKQLLPFKQSPVFRNHVIGQITDDTEMAFCLADSIIDKRGYDKEHTRNMYRAWLNSCPIDIGNTCSSGIRGVPLGVSESNGTLMRIAPLAVYSLCKPFEEVHVSQAHEMNLRCPIFHFTEQECSITHTADVVIWSTYIYVLAIRNAVRGFTRQQNYQMCYWMTVRYSRVISAVAVVLNWLENADKVWQDEQKHIGHCKLAFQFAMSSLLNQTSYDQTLDKVIRQGGDTDTNAAIVGALIGAHEGYTNIPTEYIDTITKCAPNRPRQYWCSGIDNRASCLFNLITE